MALTVYSDEHFMKEAYKQALYGYEENEIPVGAVVVCNNKIVARAYNQTERLNDATAHAEMLALTAAFNHLGSKYLTECTLYVTLEPCVMCAGASFWAQLQKVVYGASDPNRGFKRLETDILHPKTEVVADILSTECKLLIDEFFKRMRNKL